MSVIIINSYSHGGAGVISPHRYWRINFSLTSVQNADVGINYVRAFESSDRRLNVLSGGILTSNLSFAGANAEYVEKINCWPYITYDDFFDTSNNVPDTINLDYDLGVGNEQAINHVEIRGYLTSGSQTPRNFSVQFSDDDITYFTAWSSGSVATYASHEVKTFDNGNLPDPAEGVLVNHSKTYVVSGKAAVGQTVQHSKTFVVSGKRDDGLTVTEATTYVVVTP
jgi:hypothetical protein